MSGLEVRCVDVSHSYPGDGEPVPALHDIQLTVSASTTAAIMGPSGSGKSTLMTLLAGLHRPTSGRIYLGERELTRLSERALLAARAGEIGVVVQNPYRNLLAFADAIGNIRFAQRGARHQARSRLRAPSELLAELGLEHLARVRVDRLSGGERQRLALAVGLAGSPGVLLTDEPTSQLDGANRDRVVELLLRANDRFETTVIAVTHDPEVADRLGRVVRINAGRLIADGPGGNGVLGNGAGR